MFDPNVFDFIKENGYTVCSLIGSGGCSECYDVYSEQYREHFVCKIISLVGNKAVDRKKTFDNEINALTNIIHPYIIKIFKTFSNDTHLFLILEYCTKGDLYKYVKNHGPITDIRRLLQCISNILSALSYLEINNIAHRDIKPSNIFIDKYNRLKVADFGLSSITDKTKLCEEYNGSLVFVAPEVLWRKPYNSIKADIWSFGVTVCYISTGEYPFLITDRKMLINSIKEGILNIPSEIPAIVRTVLLNTLVVDPNKRMSFVDLKKIVDDELNSITQSSQKLPVANRINSVVLAAIANKRRFSHNIIIRPMHASKAARKYSINL